MGAKTLGDEGINMTSFFHWLQMGGYAGYVWSAYGIGLAILAFNVWQAKRSHRQVVHFEK